MFDLFKFFTIDQLLEWFKVHDYPASVYEDIISDEGLAYLLFFFRNGNVWATDGFNEWLFIEFV